MGLTGPSGVLPRHYTELLYRLEKDRINRNPEKHALRDWLDLFNHRLVSLFYRAWEKYRFFLPFERGQYLRPEPDLFTGCLFSLVGLGFPPLRNRLHVSVRDATADGELAGRALARIENLALLRYGGLLAQQVRSAAGLQAMLQDYFQLPVKVRQYQGQWLRIEPSQQSRLEDGGNNQLGLTTVVGERVWDIQSKFRLRIGPLGYGQFLDFLPDLAPIPERKALFLLVPPGHALRRSGARFRRPARTQELRGPRMPARGRAQLRRAAGLEHLAPQRRARPRPGRRRLRGDGSHLDRLARGEPDDLRRLPARRLRV